MYVLKTYYTSLPGFSGVILLVLLFGRCVFMWIGCRHFRSIGVVKGGLVMASWNNYGCLITVISVQPLGLCCRCGWLGGKMNTTVFNRDLGTM